jgi:hypothetical protein
MKITWSELKDSIPPLNLWNFPCWEILQTKRIIMPNVKEVKTITVVLTLTEEEASWLSDYLQNSFCVPENEPIKDRSMRKAFWDALNPPKDM